MSPTFTWGKNGLSVTADRRVKVFFPRWVPVPAETDIRVPCANTKVTVQEIRPGQDGGNWVWFLEEERQNLPFAPVSDGPAPEAQKPAPPPPADGPTSPRPVQSERPAKKRRTEEGSGQVASRPDATLAVTVTNSIPTEEVSDYLLSDMRNTKNPGELQSIAKTTVAMFTTGWKSIPDGVQTTQRVKTYALKLLGEVIDHLTRAEALTPELETELVSCMGLVNSVAVVSDAPNDFVLL